MPLVKIQGDGKTQCWRKSYEQFAGGCKKAGQDNAAECRQKKHGLFSADGMVYVDIHAAGVPVTRFNALTRMKKSSLRGRRLGAGTFKTKRKPTQMKMNRAHVKVRSVTAAPWIPQRGMSRSIMGKLKKSPTAWSSVTAPGRPRAMKAWARTKTHPEMVTSRSSNRRHP